MGKLIYATEFSVAIPDRALHHLQAVIGTKLRRGEPFYFTWRVHTGGEGRETVWLHPALPLHFSFDSSEPVQLNRAWLDELMDAASSPTGLFLSHEPGAQRTVVATGAQHHATPDS